MAGRLAFRTRSSDVAHSRLADDDDTHFRIGWRLRFTDAQLAADYERDLLRVPLFWRRFGLCKLINVVYYGTMGAAGESASQIISYAMGGAGGAYSIAIAAIEGAVVCYCFLMWHVEARRAHDCASAARPHAGVLNPADLPPGRRMLWLAALVVPIALVRIAALFTTTAEVVRLYTDGYSLTGSVYFFEYLNFTCAMLYGYGMICAILRVFAPIVVATTTLTAVAFILHIIPLCIYAPGFTNFWLVGSGGIVVSGIAVGLSYAIALLPLLVYRTQQVSSGIDCLHHDLLFHTLTTHPLLTPPPPPDTPSPT